MLSAECAGVVRKLLRAGAQREGSLRRRFVEMLTCDRLAHRVGLAVGLPLPPAAPAAAPAAAESDNGYGYLRTVEGSATLLQAESEVRTPAEINPPGLAGGRACAPRA